MKTLIRIGIIGFALASVFALSFSLFLVRKLYVQGLEPKNIAPQYHFSLYVPDNRDSFFLDIISGAQAACAQFGAAVTVHSVDPSRGELAMAAYTGVDGVVVCPYLDNETARSQLDKLSARDIPVVLINHNVSTDRPAPYVGVNNFDVGRRMGTIAGTAVQGDVRLAVVYSDKSPGVFEDKELVEIGISSALQGRLSAPIVRFRTSANPLDAEEMLYKLFRTSSAINTILFTDPIDTVAAAQVLIDMNLVGRVQVVGFGNGIAIQEYIRKGIVAGSVFVNAEKIGYEAIRALANLSESGYTSNSVDPGVEILDRSGL